MKINLSDLERLFDEINEILNFIELSQYQNRRYRIFMASNKSNINYSIPNDSIAHLLGINTNYLISTGRFNNTYSFNLLKEMCENPFRINQLHNDGIIKYENLFSPYIFKKVEGFKENIRFSITDTEIICKYKKERAYITDTKTENYDYIMVKKYNDGKIGIIGLVSKDTYYVPMSNQLYDSFEDAKETLEKYLRNQEITIITGVNTFNAVEDFDKTAVLSLDQKKSKIETALEYSNNFGCTLDVSKEVKFLLKNSEKSRNTYFEDNDLINLIVNSIKEGKLIDIELFRNTNLSKIIETFNDFLCENKINKDDSVTESYTKIRKDLEHFKSELLNAKKVINDLTDKNTSLTDQVENLTEENKNFKETEEKIYELLNKKPRM